MSADWADRITTTDGDYVGVDEADAAIAELLDENANSGLDLFNEIGKRKKAEAELAEMKAAKTSDRIHVRFDPLQDAWVNTEETTLVLESDGFIDYPVKLIVANSRPATP